MSRLNSLYYKIVVALMVFSLAPVMISGLRLLSLAQQTGVQSEGLQRMQVEFLAYVAYTAVGTLLLALFVSSQLSVSLMRLLQWIQAWRTAAENENIAAASETPADELHALNASKAEQLQHIRQALSEQKDEAGMLAAAFGRMSDVLLQYKQMLDVQMQDRNRAIEQRARQLQAAAEVGRAAATIRDLDELLTQSARLISQRFAYDHTGIFLLDESRQYAILKAASSEGGLQMLIRGHRLNVAESSIVGYVAATQQPRIALDVGADSVHFKNPYLPNTRSEMALPLIVGSEGGEKAAGGARGGGPAGRRVLGVLDIQSNHPNAFDQEDIETLQILADQIAIAIENAHLFIENQNALTEMRDALEASRRAYGEISLEAWRQLLQRRPDFGYTCGTDNLPIPVSAGWSAEMQVAVSRPEVTLLQTAHIDADTVIVPIKIRDQLAGLVKLRKPESSTTSGSAVDSGAVDSAAADGGAGSHWTASEIALMETLSDQLGVALESARLYEETQRRAERERLAGEITAKLRASNQPEAILQTAVAELRRALQVRKAQVFIHASPPTDTAPDATASGQTPDQDGGGPDGGAADSAGERSSS